MNPSTEGIIVALIPQVVGIISEYIRRRQENEQEITEAGLELELRSKVDVMVAEADAFLREKGELDG